MTPSVHSASVKLPLVVILGVGFGSGADGGGSAAAVTESSNGHKCILNASSPHKVLFVGYTTSDEPVVECSASAELK